MKDLYKEFLKELCEDVGIKVEDANEHLKQIARELAKQYKEENK